MALYRIRWEVEIEAATPHGAAEAARSLWTRGNAMAAVLEVAEVRPYEVRRLRPPSTVALYPDAAGEVMVYEVASHSW